MILDSKITKQLREIQEELTSQGQLPTRAQLAEYYDTFRNRFGPDRLASLDGEALLETMHEHGSRDSLVYWLEFKNDEELPAIFGSIAGGSALKLGIYKRRETGLWMTGSPQKQRELNLQEAIEIARRHRDQFLAGSQLLGDLPSDAPDVDYAALQEAMNRIAPDVGDSAWGHKYFSLLHPDKLDDYHNPDYQRFHLIKLLQEPPPGEGRYLVGGRFVAIARELGFPMNHLTDTLNARNARPHRYWRVGTTLGSAGSRWELMQSGDCIAVGWDALGDLSDLTYNRESKEKLRSLLQTHYPNTPQMVGRHTQQCFNFVMVLDEGDLVLPSQGKRVLGIGRVTGDYSFEPGSDMPHRRPVEWLSWEGWELPTTEGLQTTVHRIRKHVDNLLEIERRVLYAPPLPERTEPPVTAGIPARHAVRLSGVPGRIQAVLERKKQVILYGPPGTGKTYWAMVAAQELAARFRFGRGLDQLSEVEKAVVLGADQQADGLVRMCTFHPAYGYENFLEGYKPVTVNDQLLFERRDGIFKKLSDDAATGPGHRYYLIIDEINRGDIPRIFGELLTILEADKRGTSILLPLSAEPFRVPDNVYVIGTMNTADRSIALLDTALRRRFGFVELMPDSALLSEALVGGIPLGPWLDALNQRICDHIGRDARNLQVGHAYLLEAGRPISEFPRLARVVQDDIIPLLQEYCYEDYAALEKILGKSLVDVSHQRVRHELFQPSREDDLIQALLAPCPEIVTSSQAVTSDAEDSEELEGDDETDEAESTANV